MSEHKFDVDRKNHYEYNETKERNQRTKDRLTRMAEMGMEEVGIAQFGIAGVMSGLYIEKVWSYNDKDFDAYLKWAQDLKK